MFLRHKAAVLVMVLIFAAVIAAQNAPPPKPVPVPTTATPILIGSGDLLHISVLGAPEFERDVRVAENGRVSLPMIGEVAISGLSVDEAQSLIAKKLSGGGFYVDPQVSILAKEYATQGISVLGEVQKPGIYPLLGSHTLFDAISAAGGTTPRAGKTVTITRRDLPNKPQTIALSYDSNGSVQSNVAVAPGDTVVVSKAGMVYVVGDVKNPTGIILEQPNLTVLQAISMAQGTNPTAALDGTKVIRKSETGTQEIPVPLKKILSAKAPDMTLQSEDVLFVPNSLAKGIARRTFEAAVQTVTGVVIYGSRRY